MEDVKTLMTNEIQKLRNEVLKWKDEAENSKQELKDAEATVNKYGQFMICKAPCRVLP